MYTLMQMKFNDNYILLQNIIKELSLDNTYGYQDLQSHNIKGTTYQKIINYFRSDFKPLPDPPIEHILEAYRQLLGEGKKENEIPKKETESQIKEEYNVQIQKSREEFKNAGLEFPIEPKSEFDQEDIIQYLLYELKVIDVLKLENWKKSSKLKEGYVRIKEKIEDEFPFFDIPTKDEIIKILQTIEEKTVQKYQKYQKYLDEKEKLEKDKEFRDREKRRLEENEKLEKMQQIAREKKDKIEKEKSEKIREQQKKQLDKIIERHDKIESETKDYFDKILKEILGEKLNQKLSDFKQNEINDIFQQLVRYDHSYEVDTISQAAFTNCIKMMNKYIEFYPKNNLEPIRDMSEKVKMRYEHQDDVRRSYSHTTY